MEYEVLVAFNGHSKEYLVEAESHYNARIQALERFLPEFKIPGSPVDYVTRKKDVIEMSVRKVLDRRKIPKTYPQTDFYVEHINKLRKWIREGELPADKKRKITALLLKVSEVLSA